MRSRVVVVGGGLAGLAVAHDLLAARPDLDVLVVDGGDRPGGKVRRGEVAGVGLDVGAESVLASSTHARRLAEAVGLADRVVHPEPVPAAIWTRDALHPVPAGTYLGVPGMRADLRGVLTDDEAARASRGRALLASTQDRSVGEVISGAVGRAVVDRLVEPLLGGVYAGRVDELSMRAAVAGLWPAVARGGDLGAAVDALLPWEPTGRGPDATSGRPDRPARPPRLMGLDGGVVGLAEALAAHVVAAGGRVRTATLARGLERTPDGWRVVTGPTAAPEAHDAEAVVLATPATPTGRLLAPFAPAAATALAAVPYASMAVVALAVPRTPETAALPGSGFLVPAVEGRAIKASTFVSSKWAWVGRESAARDVVVLRASVGRAGDVTSLQRDDADLVRDAHAEIGRAVGTPLPAPVDQLVQRWGGGLPQYTVGHRDRVDAVRSGVAGLPGLEVAGAAYDGVGIAAVLSTAADAAAATLAHLDAARRVARPAAHPDGARPAPAHQETR